MTDTITLHRSRDGTWRLPEDRDSLVPLALWLAILIAAAPKLSDLMTGLVGGGVGGLVAQRLLQRRQRRASWPRATILRIVATALLALPARGEGLSNRPALNPDVRPETLTATVCIHGWTATVRPPLYVTNSIKRDLLRARGLSWEHVGAFTLDHIVPLCLGGHPSDQSNLQLQTVKDALAKDAYEWELCCRVCEGRMAIDDARRAILLWPGPITGVVPGTCQRGDRADVR